MKSPPPHTKLVSDLQLNSTCKNNVTNLEMLLSFSGIYGGISERNRFCAFCIPAVSVLWSWQQKSKIILKNY